MRFLSAGSDGAKALNYYCQMEKAFCFLNLADPVCTERAVEIYGTLKAQVPNSPLIYVRHAQALHELGRVKLAMEELEKAYALTQKEDRLGSALRVGIQRNLAGLCWKRSMETGMEGTEEELSWLLRAFDWIEKAMPDAASNQRESMRAANNLLFYGVEYLRKGGAEQNGRLDLRKIQTLTKECESHQMDDIRDLDTLCRAYDYLGRRKESIAIAKKILTRPKAPGSSVTDEARDSMMRYAATVLEKNARRPSPSTERRRRPRRLSHAPGREALHRSETDVP